MLRLLVLTFVMTTSFILAIDGTDVAPILTQVPQVEENNNEVAARDHNSNHQERPTMYDLRRDRQLEREALFGPDACQWPSTCNQCPSCTQDQQNIYAPN